jgi:hypothetical protein
LITESMVRAVIYAQSITGNNQTRGFNPHAWNNPIWRRYGVKLDF